MSRSKVSVGTGTQVDVDTAYQPLVDMLVKAKADLKAARFNEGNNYLKAVHMVIDIGLSRKSLKLSFQAAAYPENSAATMASRIFGLAQPKNRKLLTEVDNGKKSIKAAIREMGKQASREPRVPAREVIHGRMLKVAEWVFEDGPAKPRVDEDTFVGLAQKAYRDYIVISTNNAEAAAKTAAKKAAKLQKVLVSTHTTRKSGKTIVSRHETPAKKAA